MPEERVQLLPDDAQYEALKATIVRANLASDAARIRLNQKESQLREVVAEEASRLDLPHVLLPSLIERVTHQRDRFRQNQALHLPAGVLKWPGVDRVTFPTTVGRRTVKVRVPRDTGDLRPPLADRAVNLTVVGDDLFLVAAD